VEEKQEETLDDNNATFGKRGQRKRGDRNRRKQEESPVEE